MRFVTTAVVMTALGAQGAAAGGIDRAANANDIIFRDGNYAEIGFSRTIPSVSGTDTLGVDYDSVADSFNLFNFGVRYELNDRFSLAFTGQQDYGSDIVYGGDPSRTMLGGTTAIADTYALSLLARYKFTENFSVHGGVRADRADGTIKLSGLAYGRLNGYAVDLDETWGYGYQVGAAYEIPDIALRLAVTYNSEITHDFGTTETLPTPAGPRSVNSSDTGVDTPQSINVNFQTGVAEDTLVFANYRWADWSEFKIAPEQFKRLTGGGIVSLDDAHTYEIGVARRFTPAFAARLSVVRDIVEGDNLVSPLSPTKGYTAVALGGTYTVGAVDYSAGVRYFWLGDAQPETGTPDVRRGTFTDNDAIAFGFRVGYNF
jgi:long-subunit fatty acid transport protein